MKSFILPSRAKNGPGLTIPKLLAGPGRNPGPARIVSIGRVTYNRSRDARDLKSVSATHAQRYAFFYTDYRLSSLNTASVAKQQFYIEHLF
jgi:hypothetical protein